MLNIDSNKLIDVLNSEASPINDVFEEALKIYEYIPINQASTLNEYKNELVLKECEYNLDLVETKIRSLISKNTSVTKMMKPYKELFHKLMNKENESLNIMDILKE